MALYTKQQLIDAYLASSSVNPSEVDPGFMAAEVIRVQAEIDAQILRLTDRKANLIDRGAERVNEIQARIDNIEPVAKEKMKNIALGYISSQAHTQDDADNSEVSL
jgi:hypothetical protein